MLSTFQDTRLLFLAKKKKKSYIIAFHLFRTYISALLQLLVLKRSGRAEEKQTNETGSCASEKVIILSKS